MNQKIDGGADPARAALEDLQPNAFEGAKRMVEVAKVIFTGEDAGKDEPLAFDPLQATREPSSDTVQNPAGE